MKHDPFSCNDTRADFFEAEFSTDHPMATVGRRSLECEEETALTTTLEPTAPPNEAASLLMEGG